MSMYVTPTSGSKRKTALILCIFFDLLYVNIFSLENKYDY